MPLFGGVVVVIVLGHLLKKICNNLMTKIIKHPVMILLDPDTTFNIYHAD